MQNPFRYFNSSPEVIRLVVMMYIRYPLSLRQVEDILFERGIDICHETVRFWWNRFGPLFAAGSGSGGFIIDNFRYGVGISMKCSSASTVRHITSGGPWITKAKCSKYLPQNAGIVGLRSSF